MTLYYVSSGWELSGGGGWGGFNPSYFLTPPIKLSFCFCTMGLAITILTGRNTLPMSHPSTPPASRHNPPVNISQFSHCLQHMNNFWHEAQLSVTTRPRDARADVARFLCEQSSFVWSVVSTCLCVSAYLPKPGPLLSWPPCQIRSTGRYIWHCDTGVNQNITPALGEFDSGLTSRILTCTELKGHWLCLF